jgi:hypothetical protein
MTTARYARVAFPPFFFLIYGFVILMMVAAAHVGMKHKHCKRGILALSIGSAVPLSLVDMGFGFYIYFGKDKWVPYLKNNMHILFVNEWDIDNLEKYAWVFLFVGIGCAVMEILRAFLLIRVRRDFLEEDLRQSTRSSVADADAAAEPLLTEAEQEAV